MRMKLVTRLSLAMVATVVVTTCLHLVLTQRAIESVALPDALGQLTVQAKLLGEPVRAAVEQGTNTLLTIRASQPVQDLLRALGQPEEEAARERLARHFADVAEVREDLTQLRFLRASGFEAVRVNRVGRSARIVPTAELQDKSDRPYVKASMTDPAGAVHISPLDLNREHGQVLEPHQPVIRLATPLREPGGTLQGILVINLDMGPLLDSMRRAADDLDAYLVNEHADYLMHPDARHAFGFDLGRRFRLQDDFPALHTWPARGRFQGVVESSGDQLTTMVAIEPVPAERPKLFVMVSAPKSWIARTAGPVQRLSLGVGAAGFVLLLGMALALARSLTQPLSRLTERLHAATQDEPFAAKPSGTVEIDLLARALDDMSAQVEDQRASLQSEIEQRRHAEACARRDVERLRFIGAVIESTDDAVVTKDLNGTITSWNPAAERLFGYQASEVVGRDIRLLAPRGREQEMTSILQRIARGEHIEHFDTVRRHRDGTLVQVSLSVSPVYSSDGELIGASKIMRDIGERMRLDAELRRTNAALREFAYVASHDLQEPLRAIAGFTKLLGDRYKGQLDADADKYIHFVTDGVLRMQRLISGLLEYARAGAAGPPLQTVRCDDVMREVLSDLGPSLKERGATVAVGELPIVHADPLQLRRVLQNLVSNATKFTADSPPYVEVRAHQEEGNWVISVKDNGVGIAPEHAGRVFRIFQRVHGRDRYEGSGIGLAIAQRIVEGFGGRLWFESQPGLGTTFFFTLQAVDSPLRSDLPPRQSA